MCGFGSVYPAVRTTSVVGVRVWVGLSGCQDDWRGGCAGLGRSGRLSGRLAWWVCGFGSVYPAVRTTGVVGVRVWVGLAGCQDDWRGGCAGLGRSGRLSGRLAWWVCGFGSVWPAVRTTGVVGVRVWVGLAGCQDDWRGGCAGLGRSGRLSGRLAWWVCGFGSVWPAVRSVQYDEEQQQLKSGQINNLSTRPLRQ